MDGVGEALRPRGPAEFPEREGARPRQGLGAGHRCRTAPGGAARTGRARRPDRPADGNDIGMGGGRSGARAIAALDPRCVRPGHRRLLRCRQGANVVGLRAVGCSRNAHGISGASARDRISGHGRLGGDGLRICRGDAANTAPPCSIRYRARWLLVSWKFAKSASAATAS